MSWHVAFPIIEEADLTVILAENAVELTAIAVLVDNHCQARTVALAIDHCLFDT